MIISGNTNINKVYYSGYTISKIYACGGSLVWSGDTPTPTGTKFSAVFSDTSTYSADCDGNSKLSTGDTTSKIGYSRMSGMTDAYIGDCVTTIGPVALGNIRDFQLSSVTMSSNVTTFEHEAFYGANNLSRINSNTDGLFDLSNVLLLGNYSLYKTNVQNVILNNNAVLGEATFHSCKNLKSITIPNITTEIPIALLVDCTSLTSVTIPNSVTVINHNAFDGCTALSALTIPSGVTTIYSDAFRDCKNLLRLNSNVDGVFNIPTGVTSINDGVFAMCERLETVNIPSGVTSISEGAFASCISLTNITIPSGVTRIAGSLFQNCTSLTNIDIPTGVTKIQSSAFTRCYSLISIDIPDSVTEIYPYAFEYCSGLTSVTIGSGVTNIGQYAFDVCTSLASITINATTPPTLGNKALAYTNDCPIYVPSGSVSAYQSASGWSDYASRIQAIP